MGAFNTRFRFVWLFGLAVSLFITGCTPVEVADEAADDASSTVVAPAETESTEEDKNPFWSRVLVELERVDRELNRLPAQPPRVTTARQLRDMYEDLDFWTWAYAAEQSSLAGDERLRQRIEDALRDIARHENEGSFNQPNERVDANMDRFILANLGQAWLWLERGAPEVAAALADEVLPVIERGAEAQMAVFGQVGTQPHGPTWYPNIDATWALHMWTAGAILDRSDWIEAALNRWEKMADRIHPGGGWTYMGYTNPELAYQTVAVRQLGRFFLHSEEPIASELARQLAEYYPRITERGGVAEGSTSPYWKQRWDAVTPDGPAIIAGLSESADNAALAAHLAPYYLEPSVRWVRGDILTAALLYPGAETAWTFQDGIHFDPDSGGPRARFGRWSFATSGRDWKDDRGKWTYGGVMLLDDAEAVEARAYPLSAAIQTAGFEIEVAGRTLDLTMSDQCEWVIEDSWTTFSAVYQYQHTVHGGGRSRAIPWHGSQQWLFTEDRVVFAASLWAEGRRPADALKGVLRLGNGRGLPLRNHPRTPLETIDENTWQMGDLVIRLHVSDFSGRAIADEPNYRGHTSALRLLDDEAAEERLFPPFGEPRYYVFEAYRKEVEPADAVTFSTLPNGVARLEVSDTQGNWVMVHNYGDAVIGLPNEPTSGVRYVSFNAADTDAADISGNGVDSIEPGRHVVQLEALPLVTEHE